MSAQMHALAQAWLHSGMVEVNGHRKHGRKRCWQTMGKMSHAHMACQCQCRGQASSRLPQAVLLDQQCHCCANHQTRSLLAEVLQQACARSTGRPVATTVTRALLQPVQSVHRQTLRQPCQGPWSHLLCSGCWSCSLHMGTDIRRPGHTLSVRVMGARGGRFSLLEVSTVLEPRYLTLLLGEGGTIHTVWVPACRHGPGTAETHSSD